MIYGAHQVSFIPWVGFWQKVSNVDYFDISIYDQFTKNTWQHFSFISAPNVNKQKWGLVLDKDFKHNSTKFNLNQVKVVPNFSSRLLSEFEAQHKTDKYFDCIFPTLISWLEKVDKMNSLWLINFILLEEVKTFLGIETPFFVSPPDLEEDASLNIIKNVLRYNCDQYLSGPHGVHYLNQSLFAEHNVSVKFQNTSFLYENYPLSLPATISRHGLKKTLELINDKK